VITSSYFFSSAAGDAVVAGGATFAPMTGPLLLGDSPGLGRGLWENAKEESVKAIPNNKILSIWFAMRSPQLSRKQREQSNYYKLEKTQKI
jgi:hypothetical protein